MKIGIAGCFHETNTFAPGITGLPAFQREWYEGDTAFRQAYAGTKTSMGAGLDASDILGIETIPLFYTYTTPSAMVEEEAVDAIINTLIQSVASEAEQIDGLLLIVHGAMVSESTPDVEGLILRRLRSILGNKPIAMTIDLHANVSEEMNELADYIVGYDTYPHIDAYERGLEACGLLHKHMEGCITPARYLARPGVLIAPTLMNTNTAPMSELMDLAFRLEREEGVLNVTVAGGFAYADVHCAGFTFVVTTDNDSSLAKRIGDELADWLLMHQEQFAPKLIDAKTVIDQASLQGRFPTVLVESSDNVGAGSPADATHVLRALLEQKQHSFMIVICDRQAVAWADNIGVGHSFCCSVGGKTDQAYNKPRMHGEPVEIAGTIRCLSDGKYKHKGPYMTGMAADMGRTAVIELDRGDGSLVVLTEQRVAPWDINHVRCLGIDPTKFDFIVVKAAVAWRTAFGELAAQAIELDTPGCCSSNLSRLPYRNIASDTVMISGKVPDNE
ncbi:M81 family metallopeptidase [Paenibacillus nasutitermitis]|uniref:Microcystinase C n=1 Tax=Paenibacillus nasutitermitis TaxID=1652958 RepID=A0A916ZJC6_9BACL|nr:M81 family metallopeptidase [Paenibacillus nasutitermitis]GGD99194.1 microcystinase C [Paenibacillus nasutitermitis]